MADWTPAYPGDKGKGRAEDEFEPDDVAADTDAETDADSWRATDDDVTHDDIVAEYNPKKPKKKKKKKKSKSQKPSDTGLNTNKRFLCHICERLLTRNRSVRDHLINKHKITASEPAPLIIVDPKTGVPVEPIQVQLDKMKRKARSGKEGKRAVDTKHRISKPRHPLATVTYADDEGDWEDLEEEDEEEQDDEGAGRQLEKVTSKQVKKGKGRQDKGLTGGEGAGVELLKKPAPRGIRFVRKRVEDDGSDEEIEEVQESEHPTLGPAKMIRRTAPMPQNPEFYMDLMLGGHVFRSTSRNLEFRQMILNLQNAQADNLVPVPVLYPPGAKSRLEPGAYIVTEKRRCGRWAAAHWDFVLEEMKWKWTDFRKKRRLRDDFCVKAGGWAMYERGRRCRTRGKLIAAQGLGEWYHREMLEEEDVQEMVEAGDLEQTFSYVEGEKGWVCEKIVEDLNGQWWSVRRWLGYRREKEYVPVVNYKTGRKLVIIGERVGWDLGKEVKVRSGSWQAYVQVAEEAAAKARERQKRQGAKMGGEAEARGNPRYATPEPEASDFELPTRFRPSTV